MAELGHEVVGVDIDPGKVAKLAAGDVPFYEPGLRKMLRDNIAAGRSSIQPPITTWLPASPTCISSGGHSAEEGRITAPT